MLDLNASLDFAALRNGYESGALTPTAVVEGCI